MSSNPIDRTAHGTGGRSPSMPSVQIIFTPPTMTELEVDIVDPGHTVLTVQLAGELDATNASFVAAVLKRRITETPREVRMDLSRLRFCDGAGLGILVWAHGQVALRGATLALVGVGSAVARLLSVSHLDGVLLVADSVEVGRADVEPPHRGVDDLSA